MPDGAERALRCAQEAVAVAERAIERARDVLQQETPPRARPRPAVSTRRPRPCCASA